MTTVTQDRDFIATIVNSTLLEEAIKWIGDNMSPEDVFSKADLLNWADENELVEKYQ